MSARPAMAKGVILMRRPQAGRGKRERQRSRRHTRRERRKEKKKAGKGEGHISRSYEARRGGGTIVREFFRILGDFCPECCIEVVLR